MMEEEGTLESDPKELGLRKKKLDCFSSSNDGESLVVLTCKIDMSETPSWTCSGKLVDLRQRLVKWKKESQGNVWLLDSPYFMMCQKAEIK